MAAVKSMLKRCVVEIAQRKRTCKHSRLEIIKGEKCLVIFDTQFDRFCYSKPVALRMIEQARQALNELETGLSD